MDPIAPVTNVDPGSSRYARLLRIEAAQAVAEAAAMQEPKPPEAVSVLRDLAVARFSLLASGPDQENAAAAVAAYNRASRVLNAVADSGPILPQLRG